MSAPAIRRGRQRDPTTVSQRGPGTRDPCCAGYDYVRVTKGTAAHGDRCLVQLRCDAWIRRDPSLSPPRRHLPDPHFLLRLRAKADQLSGIFKSPDAVVGLPVALALPSCMISRCARLLLWLPLDCFAGIAVSCRRVHVFEYFPIFCFANSNIESELSRDGISKSIICCGLVHVGEESFVVCVKGVW